MLERAANKSMSKRKVSTETIKFNIGGKHFEVSRDMLETNHPDTMLARIASEKWQEDPEAEIFIDRDGSIFNFVLSYLRDDEVHLPLTTSKEMIIKELAYYGIDFEESKIHEKILNKARGLKAVTSGVKKLESNTNLLELQFRGSKAAAEIVRSFLKTMKTVKLTSA